MHKFRAIIGLTVIVMTGCGSASTQNEQIETETEIEISVTSSDHDEEINEETSEQVNQEEENEEDGNEEIEDELSTEITFKYNTPIGFSLQRQEDGRLAYINPFADSIKIWVRELNKSEDQITEFLENVNEPEDEFLESLSFNKYNVDISFITVREGFTNGVKVIYTPQNSVTLWETDLIFVHESSRMYEISMVASLEELSAGIAVIEDMIR